MTTSSGFNEIEQSRFVNAAAREILVNQKQLRKFRKGPELILEDKVKDIPQANRSIVKAEIRQRVQEADQVLPGLNSDEAKEMLNASLKTPAMTFKIFTWLNVLLFGVGIGLFVLAAIFGFIREEEQFSIIFGASGFASLIPLFITNPLKRVSNAASDQSQLRIVIFGYWSQLANLRTQIMPPMQTPDLATVKDLNAELQKAMGNATAQLQKYVEANIQDTDQDKEKDIKTLKDRVEALEKKLGK